ncbi:MAG: glycosyltransferase family 1 protein [Myxococcota bacterium]|nr:glycosyltransferase family 1 protein [Myxococcota bacterium]
MYLRPGHVGGSEVYCRQLLKELHAMGVPLRLFCTQEAADTFTDLSSADIRVLSQGGYRLPQRLWAENGALARQLYRDPVSVLHSPGNFGAPLLPLRVPQVITIHDLQHIHVPELFPRTLRMQRTAWFRGSILRSVHIIAISTFTGIDVMTQFGVPPEKVTVVLEGVDRSKTHPSTEVQQARRLEYGLSQPFVYYPATENRHKNHELLIDAMTAVPEPIELVLTGRKGMRWDDIQDYAMRAGVKERIRHLGFVPRSHVFDLLYMARALVFPSLFEGFGLPVLEAMQCDTPAIVSNAASLPEVAGDAAMLLSPQDASSWANAISQLHTDNELRSKFIRLGRKNLDRFSWQRCAQQTANIYARVGAR